MQVPMLVQFQSVGRLNVFEVFEINRQVTARFQLQFCNFTFHGVILIVF